MNNFKNHKSALIYLSPHGSTRKAMEVLAQGMEESGYLVEMIDLGEYIKDNTVSKLYNDISRYYVLIFGVPAYCHHAPPVFSHFTKEIPRAVNGQLAGMLVTFGGVSTGAVLSDFAKSFIKKGYGLIGGIKVLSEHCLMFQGDNPLGSGHPNAFDYGIIKEFAREISKKANQNEWQGEEVRAFNDKSFSLNFLDATVLNMKFISFVFPTPRVLSNLCTQCGKCVESCPVGNITLDEYPQYADRCIKCFSCVRNCSQGAIKASLKPLESFLRLMARIFGRNERQQTEQII